MKRIAMVLLFGGALTLGADSGPKEYKLWTASQFRVIEKQLSTTGGKLASQNLADFGNHSFLITRRLSTGPAEVHETQDDVFIVQSGESTLILGGTVVEPTRTGQHEIRGTSIRGGEEKELHPGDVVHIQAGTPHQVRVDPGKQVTTLFIKIDLK